MKIPRNFESDIIRRLLNKKEINKDDSVLVVCGGLFDKKLLEYFGFKNYLITSNLESNKTKGIEKYSKENAMDLSFQKNSFDIVMVMAGLHHCSMPHKALCEMYRVSKRKVVVFESQDSFIMRIFIRLGLAEKYECSSKYGVDSTKVPNYIYRWTKREVEKTISSYNPPEEPKIKYYIKFNFIPGIDKTTKFKYYSFLLQKIGKLAELMLNIFLKNKGNGFCFVVNKKPFTRKNIC